MHTPELALGLVLALVSLPSAAMDSPNLGRSIAPSEIQSWDITIGPDGAGLPPGTGAPKEGAEIYAVKCAACHGERGGGKPHDRLVGGPDLLTDEHPTKTIGNYWPYATTVFDFVRRAMPLTEPQSLSNHEVYALVAYLLNLNGIIGDDAVLDAKSLPKVKMPNRVKFFPVYPKNSP